MTGGGAAPRRGPLSGLRVIDLTQMLSGPFATMLLADMGADVVKVEPLIGDDTRRAGPWLEGDTLRSYGGYFQSVNRNKRSIALDLKTDAGREALLRLVDGADAVLENYRVGVMERLGLSYETLRERRPGLVYTAIRGFGDPRSGESPYMNWPAYDVVAQAMGGIMGITGPGPGQPTKVGPGIGDVFPACLAAVGTLAALLHARETGRGQFVDVAMYDSILALCERLVYQYSYTGEVAEPHGNGHPLLCPFDVFPARDGWVALAAFRDHQWRLLCDLIGSPESGADPKFATNAARVEHSGEVRAVLSAWTAVRTRQEITDVLGGQVPVGPVNSADAIFQDPHVAVRRMLVEVEQPGADRTVTIAGTPMKFIGTPSADPRRAPVLGEDREAVLLEAGCSPAEVETWRLGGAFGEPSAPPGPEMPEALT
ncbi:CaiB/BaiF CoA transferase family protein [Blastococcus tunisiensis]|uniref:Crotonobetainyl-CoA:carnitine CoA-transferase CaiB n=1 Tax=Blastococcus tunisiensis TaxID=1798228 RepID=A0A1I1ZR30_9ACTN|nr:CoA transferase [Blastococcus sp. DSM 46838]SFE34189.1 Crotonobetainyl-CoA:carnitine CoA-transferase CaiB [Blastococcus sp. DSM 46838]